MPAKRRTAPAQCMEQIQASYTRFSNGAVHSTRVIVNGRCHADYDKDGVLIGIESISPIEVTAQTDKVHLRINSNGLEMSHAK